MKKRISLLFLALVFVFYPATTFADDHNDANPSNEEDSQDNPLYSDDNEDDPEVQDTTPDDPVSKKPITKKQLVDGKSLKGLTENSQFAPPSDPDDPTMEFNGTLKLDHADMGTSPEFKLGKGELRGKDTTIFPNVSIDFFTEGTDLVPVTQDLIPNGTLKDTKSYWDMIVQPGRVWHSPDDRDDDWNRASFPFALVNRLEGETHTGIALFLYKDDKVSHVRFQVVAETRPGEVPDYFNAWGVTKASYETGGIDHLKEHKQKYRQEVKQRFPTAPLSELKEKVGADKLAKFDGATNDEEKDHVLQTGLLYDGVLYRSAYHTAAGPFPYHDQTRYGVWSVTKSALMNVSMLHLAQKYGSDLLDEKIADYISIPEKQKGWKDVTIGDMANMASGHGATEDDPTCYLCDYERWNLAPSNDEKIDEALDYPRVWKPGTKYVYRDQDAFLLGVTLEKFLQGKEGDDATLDQMLREEVFEPIGIYHLPANHTIENEGQSGHLKTEFGYYPTLDDLAKIALLYEKHGKWDGHQILNRQLVDSLLPKQDPPEMALPKAKEEDNEFGTRFYAMNWHIEPYRTSEGCQLYLPNMEGFGGNLVTLMPDHVVGLRMANSPDDGFDSTVSQARAGSQLVSFCLDHDHNGQGGNLPKTASKIPIGIMMGIMVTAIGVVLIVFTKRKFNKSM